MSTWTVQQVLDWTVSHFQDKQIESARLDAELLLAHALKKNRVFLYTNFDQPLSQEERDVMRGLVKRRSAREPVAYILGEKEFYGRPFVVNADVLIPRPETEHLVDAVLGWLKEQELQRPRILDVGCGSGAIGLSLAAELPASHVVLTDISQGALDVAAQNARRLEVNDRVEFRLGETWTPVEGERFDVVASNPPYIAPQQSNELAPDIVEHEPKEALFAEGDGLACVTALCARAGSYLNKPGYFACEVGAGQADAALAQMDDQFSQTSSIRDLAGHARVVWAAR